MYFFDNIGVFFNNSGIIAESATISSSNSLIFNSPLGSRNSKGIPSGPTISNASINYTPKFLSDPLINNIINQNSILDLEVSLLTERQVPTILKIGNISGTFFLKDYRFSIENNEIITATTNFISFSNLSGEGQYKKINSLADADTEIGHAWSTSIVDENGNENDWPLLSVEYSFSKNIQPIYKLGQKEPDQVIAVETSRKVGLTFEDVYYVDFSGKFLSSSVSNDNTNSFEYIKIQGYSSLAENSSLDGSSGSSGSSGYSGYSGYSGVTEVLLSTKNMPITQIDTSISINNILAVKVEAEKTI